MPGYIILRNNKTTKKTKAMGFIGAALYIGLPLSYLFGVSGEIVQNVKSRRKWNESMGYAKLMRELYFDAYGHPKSIPGAILLSGTRVRGAKR